MKENKVGSTIVSSYDYSVNTLRQRTAVDTVGSALTAGEPDRTWSYDALGQVTAESDANNAAFHRGFAYDAFGNVIFSSGASATSFQHRFSTKPQDAESGLCYYGYRYYDPVTGRWSSRDPIGERGGYNLYELLGSNGISRTDYLGREDNQKRDHEVFLDYKEVSFAKGKCGHFRWDIEWVVKGPKGLKGHVLQELKVNGFIEGCGTNAQKDPSEDHFREAWRYPADSIKDTWSSKDIMNSNQYRPCKGEGVINSTAFFVKDLKEGDFAPNPPPDLTPIDPGFEDEHPEPLIHPEAPPFQADFVQELNDQGSFDGVVTPSSNTKTIELKFKWDCCNERNDTEVWINGNKK